MNKIEIPDNIRGLIFDLDGTLVDTMSIHYLAWREACLFYNFDFPIELFYKLAGIPSKTIISMLNQRYRIDLDPEKTAEMKEISYLKKLDSVKTIKPVMDIVIEYHGKIKMSIGTGGRKNVANTTITKSGLDRYIDIVVTADDVQRHKPFPDTFFKCAEMMGIPPSECLVFEDGIPGLEAARNAGMDSIDIRDYL